MAKPVARPVGPVPPVPRAVGPVPVAARPPVARPVAAHPRVPKVVASTPSEGGGTAVFCLLLLLAGGGGVWWYASHQSTESKATASAPVVEAAPVVAPTPVPVRQETAAAPAPAQPAVVAAAPIEMPVLPKEPVVAKPAAPSTDYKELLVLDANAGRSPAALDRWGAVMRAAYENNQWTDYLGLLRRSLEKELRKSPDFESIQRYDTYTGNPLFYRALLQYLLGSRLGNDARAVIADDERVRQFLIWLSQSPEAMESFLRTATEHDKIGPALQTWAMLGADDPETLGKYRELAIACSLVFEKPHEFAWNGDKIKVSAEDRYRWYKAKDKAGLLASHLTKMSAWQLAWVVGVPVPESEMEWALTELTRKLHQKDWGRAYDMVPYDMQKAVTGKMKNPYDYYTFAEILKKGGVCSDRAYFSANTARSAGLPAVAISGDGPRGPHAWIAWLQDEDRWAFSGRFDGYPAGTVHDPRNGDKLSEQKFTRLSDHDAPSENTVLRAQRLVWISDVQKAIGQTKEADLALDLALKINRRQDELWQKRIAAMRAQVPPAAPATWKTLLDALRREFKDDTDMLAIARTAEDEFVLSKLDAASVKNELRGDVHQLAKMKGLTSLEEIRVAYRREGDLFVKASDWTGLRHIYKDALDDYGREASKFKALAHDYWDSVKIATPEVRLAACRDIDNSFERHVETKSGDYFDVTSQNSAAKVVAECWRAAGDVAKADRIEKDIAKRGKKATKDAL